MAAHRAVRACSKPTSLRLMVKGMSRKVSSNRMFTPAVRARVRNSERRPASPGKLRTSFSSLTFSLMGGSIFSKGALSSTAGTPARVLRSARMRPFSGS